MDFSVIPGNAGYMLWKIKFIKLWTRYMVKNYTRKNTDMTVIKKYEST
jgi:hypothetical protein